MLGTEYIQTTDANLLFRDVSLYTETISSPAQAPAIIHQAIAAAYAGRGVAHLTLPQDVILAKADGGVPSVATLKPRPEIVAGEDDIAEIARGACFLRLRRQLSDRHRPRSDRRRRGDASHSAGRGRGGSNDA
jgi:thiamine pyrophosphate-dependent acetolactate synthase large subunit-like protein